MKNKIDIELSFLKKTGEIRFTKGNRVYNAVSKEILYELVSEEERKELDKFFNSSEDIEVILGNEILCG
tara:strand:- start:7548 stop:7754 length:207 start_codon:yes stop_codon:yes gene_type:complete